MTVKSRFVRIREQRTARLRRQRREELCNPVLDYLAKREAEAETLDDKDHYTFCRKVVCLALEGWSKPYIAASYYHYGGHPDRLVAELERRRAYAQTLGPSLADLLKNPLFMPTIEIPDYDPTIPMQLPPSQWRQRRLPLEPAPLPHVTAAKCPLRLIVRRSLTVEDGCRYFTEELTCGHLHIEFMGGNEESKRRRCQECKPGVQDGAAPPSTDEENRMDTRLFASET